MSSSYLALAALAVLAVCIEWHVRDRRHQPVDRREARLSLSVGAIAYLLGFVTQGAFLVLAFTLATQVAPWHLSATQPLVYVVFFVVDDFVNYVVHRAEHRVPFLWASHVVHHSTEDLNLISAARLSPVEALYQPMLVLWAPLLGFPVVIYAPLTVVALVIGQLQHTQVIGKLRWLDGWLATPSNHRVHHGKNPQYIDKNFGNSLMIWDRLFGTYQPEEEAVVFGVLEPLPRSGVVGIAAGTYPEWVKQRWSRLPLRLAYR